MIDAEALQHSERVREHIAVKIHAAAGGWLSFELFMDLALYAPGFWATTARRRA